MKRFGGYTPAASAELKALQDRLRAPVREPMYCPRCGGHLDVSQGAWSRLWMAWHTGCHRAEGTVGDDCRYLWDDRHADCPWKMGSWNSPEYTTEEALREAVTAGRPPVMASAETLAFVGMQIQRLCLHLNIERRKKIERLMKELTTADFAQ